MGQQSDRPKPAISLRVSRLIRIPPSPPPTPVGYQSHLRGQLQYGGRRHVRVVAAPLLRRLKVGLCPFRQLVTFHDPTPGGWKHAGLLVLSDSRLREP
ncbi:hypothetical protein EYF80_055920 [Liparis tanakae]|uniref:Uncharacterized protein n=1 Tax=Liparis tanakae TaxID=230148 RepID=A0A4Z2EZG1_9TELE|nr:hypothetical protein EYF80_055920 [Liparis tanakae]